MTTMFVTPMGDLFLACDEGCAESFIEDRRCGLIYGLHRKPDGGWYLGREEWSIVEKRCAYCGTPVPVEEP